MDEAWLQRENHSPTTPPTPDLGPIRDVTSTATRTDSKILHLSDRRVPLQRGDTALLSPAMTSAPLDEVNSTPNNKRDPQGTAAAGADGASTSVAEKTDFTDIVNDIVAEAQRRRDSGEYSAERLERLDAEFDRFAPLTYRRIGVEGAIRAVESAAFISVDVPTGASRRPFQMVKEAIKRSTAWYHLHVARQVTTLGIQVTRPLRMLHDNVTALDGRVRNLEAATGIGAQLRHELVGTGSAPAYSARATAAAVHAVASLDGVVAGCNLTTEEAQALAEAHPDMCIVDPITHLDGAVQLDVRTETTSKYLASLGDDVLVGAVLSNGVVNQTSTNQRLSIIHDAVRSVAPGGRVVVVNAPVAELSQIQIDLAEGQPWNVDTWRTALTHLGCRSVNITDVDDVQIVVASVA